MRKIALLVPLALGLAGAATVPVLAAPAAQSAAPQADRAYFDLYDAIIGGVDLEQVSIKASGEVFDAISRNEPEFARMARGKPGVRDRFIAMCMPYFRLWMPRSLKIARERSVAALVPVMTPAEAREIANFYASPLGRKVSAAMANNLTFASQLDSQMQGGDFDDADAANDDERQAVGGGVRQLMKSLTAKERQQLAAFTQSKAYQKIDAMNRALAGVVAPTSEEISTPEERDDFRTDMVNFLDKEFGR